MTQSDDFAKAIYRLCLLGCPIFKIISFLQYLVFFQAVFCTEQLEITFTIDFDMFFGILIIDPKWRFCKGYRLCILGWPIFKIVSFLQYLVFFEAVFCTKQLEITFTIDFDMFFWILIFDPKWRFCKGYMLRILGRSIF